MQLDLGFLAAMVSVFYLMNVLVGAVRKRDLSGDRLLLRAPIVAVFATYMFVALGMVGGTLMGAAAALALVLWDVTPGKMMGKHA